MVYGHAQRGLGLEALSLFGKMRLVAMIADGVAFHVVMPVMLAKDGIILKP